MIIYSGRRSWIIIRTDFSYNYELRITNYELRITNYELRITNYELRITNYELRIGGRTIKNEDFDHKEHTRNS
jgi:hypothetical protein